MSKTTCQVANTPTHWHVILHISPYFIELLSTHKDHPGYGGGENVGYDEIRHLDAATKWVNCDQEKCFIAVGIEELESKEWCYNCGLIGAARYQYHKR